MREPQDAPSLFDPELQVALLLGGPPKVTWKHDDTTGEDLVSVPEICGPFAWAQLHSWAQNLHDEICHACGTFAIQATIALHDLVNHKLGKPIRDPENLRVIAQYFQEAVSHDRAEAAMGNILASVVTGIGLGAGFKIVDILTNRALGGSFGEEIHDGKVDHLDPNAQSLELTKDGDFIRERVIDPENFHPDSFRTIVTGEHRRIVACPTAQWDGDECKGSMKVQTILHPFEEFGWLAAEATGHGVPVIEAGLEIPLPEEVEAFVKELEESGKLREAVSGAA